MSRMVMVSCASARGYALGLTSDIFLELRESGGGAEGQQSSVPEWRVKRGGFRGADEDAEDCPRSTV